MAVEQLRGEMQEKHATELQPVLRPAHEGGDTDANIVYSALANANAPGGIVHSPVGQSDGVVYSPVGAGGDVVTDGFGDIYEPTGTDYDGHGGGGGDDDASAGMLNYAAVDHGGSGGDGDASAGMLNYAAVDHGGSGGDGDASAGMLNYAAVDHGDAGGVTDATEGMLTYADVDVGGAADTDADTDAAQDALLAYSTSLVLISLPFFQDGC